MYFFHRIDSKFETVQLFLIILLAVTLLMFLPACSKDNAENMTGPVSSDSYDPPDRQGDQAQQGRMPGGQAPDSQAPGGRMPEMSGEQQQDIARLNELQQKLMALQQKVLQNNPEMQEDQQALQNALESKLEKTMAARNVEVERIQELQALLQDPNLPEEEKSALIGEFQTQAQQYNQAQAEAMNDPEVQEKYTRYVSDMQALMEEENPDAPALTREFEELQSRLQAQQQR